MGREKHRAHEESDSSDAELVSEAERSDTSDLDTVSVSTPSLLHKTFDTPKELEAVFADFCRRTHQNFYKRTSTTRQQRNKQIQATYAKSGNEPPDSELLRNPAFPLYLTSYLCPTLESREIVVVANDLDAMFVHWAAKPSFIYCSAAKATATSWLYHSITRNTTTASEKPKPCMVDVHNLLAKLKREEGAGTTVSERLAETLNRFCKEEKYGVAHVDIDRVGKESELPQARVLLCKFHAVKYIQERIAKAALIVKARTEAEYDECFRFMREELGVPDTDVAESNTTEDVGAPLFWTYFAENWHKCREMWLESSWQKIKTIADQNVDIGESVTSLIWWAKFKQKAFTAEVARVGQVFDPVHHTSVELTRLAQMVSRYAFDIIKEQYDIATKADTYYDIRDEGTELYVVASATYNCKVDTSVWTSYCMLGITQKLPCRHLLYLRKRMDIPALIPFGYLDDRWRYKSAAMLDRFLVSDYEVSGYSGSNFVRLRPPREPTQKYNDSLVHAKRIAEAVCQYGGRQYEQGRRILYAITSAFAEGRLDDLDAAVARLREPRDFCEDRRVVDLDSPQE
ncbi:hypothetical protein ON010_g631 [Phytophthora cinnamomi]|nr:hypothetical protein ON010_g631 [Phytophthora cinnamomi]